MFGGNFSPAGWNFCDGTLLPISEYETLFQLIGTTYGGDGQSNFAVPDLRGRVPVHNGTGGGQTFTLGEQAGVEAVTLTSSQIPQHTHPLQATTVLASAPDPANNLFAQTRSGTQYLEDTPALAMAPAIGPVGGSQPHENLQPFLCVSFIISLFGVFPSQT
jgi:microcystin-dependent protein